LKTFQNTNNFKGIIYVFLKHTTLASVTTSAPGLQTAFDGARERTVFDGTSKRSPSPRRGVLSLCYFSAIPAGVSVYFLHFYNQRSSFVSSFLVTS